MLSSLVGEGYSIYWSEFPATAGFATATGVFNQSYFSSGGNFRILWNDDKVKDRMTDKDWESIVSGVGWKSNGASSNIPA